MSGNKGEEIVLMSAQEPSLVPPPEAILNLHEPSSFIASTPNPMIATSHP